MALAVSVALAVFLVSAYPATLELAERRESRGRVAALGIRERRHILVFPAIQASLPIRGRVEFPVTLEHPGPVASLVSADLVRHPAIREPLATAEYPAIPGQAAFPAIREHREAAERPASAGSPERREAAARPDTPGLPHIQERPDTAGPQATPGRPVIRGCPEPAGLRGCRDSVGHLDSLRTPGLPHTLEPAEHRATPACRASADSRASLDKDCRAIPERQASRAIQAYPVILVPPVVLPTPEQAGPPVTPGRLDSVGSLDSAGRVRRAIVVQAASPGRLVIAARPATRVRAELPATLGSAGPME